MTPTNEARLGTGLFLVSGVAVLGGVADLYGVHPGIVAAVGAILGVTACSIYRAIKIAHYVVQRVQDEMCDDPSLINHYESPQTP